MSPPPHPQNASPVILSQMATGRVHRPKVASCRRPERGGSAIAGSVSARHAEVTSARPNGNEFAPRGADVNDKLSFQCSTGGGCADVLGSRKGWKHTAGQHPRWRGGQVGLSRQVARSSIPIQWPLCEQH